MQSKKIFFQFIKFFPLSLLIVILCFLVLHYYHLKAIVPLNLKSEIDKYYDFKEWRRSDIVSALPLINDKTVVALGESSMIVPGSCNDSHKSFLTFPALLDRYLKNDGLSVLNLGYCGDDSKGILGEVKFILHEKRPRAFLFYFGHNDFGNVSRDVIFSKTELIDIQFWLRDVFFFLSSGAKFQIEYFVRNAIEAGLIKFARKIDPMLFNRTDFQKISGQISEHLNKNVIAIIDLCRSHKVPMIFISPVGNYLYPPVGADNEIGELYRKGKMKEDMSLLAQAAEQDYFGHDQRAKNSVREIFSNQIASDVLVIDLPSQVNKQQLNFFKNSFSDIFHFSENGHRFVYDQIVAGRVSKFLEQNH